MKRCLLIPSLAAAVPALLLACNNQPASDSSMTGAASSPVVIENAAVHGKSARRSVESRWIRPVVGERDESLGARVEGIEALPDNNSHAVSISLPRKSPEIEEVIVYGRIKKDEVRQPILQPTRVEVLNSPEQNGIVIYLPELQDFVLRINYYEAPSDVVPDLISD